MAILDETENEFRYRLIEPSLFISDSFRSKKLLENGLSLIIGKLKDDESGSMKGQSLRFSKSHWDKKKALTWVSGNKEKFSVQPDKLYSIKNVEIFSGGETSDGRNINSSNLDDMISAFTATKDKFRPFLKLGHSEKQKILQSDGLPAAGYVENVVRKGNKLFADFVDIPKKIYKLLKNKAYRKVSCEIYHNIVLGDKKHARLLTAVSLLGSDVPAILSLNDILALYSNDHEFSTVESFTTDQNCDIITTYHNDDKDKIMPPDEKLKFQLEQEQDRVKKLEAKLSDQSKSIEKFTASVSKLEENLAEKDKIIIEAQQKEKEAKIEKFTSELLSDKFISKAMAPLVTQLLGDHKEKYSHAEKELSREELVKEIFSLSKEAAKVNFDDQTQSSDMNNNESDEIKIQKFANENKISYTEAYKELNRGKLVSKEK